MEFGEALTVTGLLMDMLGIWFLSLSGIMGDKPFQTLVHLRRNVERGELGDSPEMLAHGSGFPIQKEPFNTRHYDYLVHRLTRVVVGVVLLISGFATQIVGTVV